MLVTLNVNHNFMNNDFIQSYIEAIIKKAGVDNMPDDFKKEYTEKLKVEAEKRLGLMAMGELDEQGLAEFEKFMQDNKKPNSGQMLDFFVAKIPDFENKVKQALEEFADEFIKGAADLKGTKLS